MQESIQRRAKFLIPYQRRLVLFVLLAQAGITVTGSIVRVTGSGLGCNTWPLCHEGSLVPVPGAAPWIHQAIEFGNRLLTFVLIGIVIAAFISIVAAHRRKELVIHGIVQGIGVIIQAVLGGISVLLDLQWWSVAIHFLPSMLLVWLAAIFYIRVGEPDAGIPHRTYDQSLRYLVSFAAGLLVLVLATGTMVTGAGPHAGDSEAGMQGRLEVDIAWMAHIHAWTMYLLLAVVTLIAASLAFQRVPTKTKTTTLWLIATIVLQALIGVIQYRLGVPRWTVPVHIGFSSVVVALLGFLYAQGWSRHPEDTSPEQEYHQL
ncbi:COX15/CtaA family protein [Corynebacterium sp. ES2794-CONJ1]|uniref:COX15/CtaA family protein n=1 Tax=unclassified Corynebacterium TaxID=2624378 RepID=UPI002168BE39|nr:MULTISPECIES: COX15/CtaA family protein [unclassified Corynebacterium]MCS4489295.1 COX15/CtaA family protein [Corynebacterium sp. ES2775-CONJ]MCS4491108.1 COX15/CtaA family protein [Corynebacterium sp. ES2715-CONJ3]MCS4531011.1 COX15/CtaA family protein [Corynebacterium sp. ES2730-CONJ]MCU9518378.1 COX15/CtaA family protein [Corynebacterium sp. ES2794-CONJ1]